jgi:TP901 family phage tail tape measure protein
VGALCVAFNISAQLTLQGPANLQNVRQQIVRGLGDIRATVDVQISQGSLSALAQMNSQLTALKSTLQGVQREAATTASAVNSVNTAMSRTASANSQASISFSGNAAALTSTTRALSEASDAFDNFGRQAGLAARRYSAFLIAGGGIVGFISAIRNGVSEALQFEREMIRIGQVTGESSAEIGKVAENITSISTAWGVSSKNLSQAAVLLASAGYKAGELNQALEALAKTTLTPQFGNLIETTNGAIAVMAQFKLQTKDLEGVFGAINAVSNQYAVESKDIIEAIKRTGGAFNTAGGNLNEFLALFSAVRSTTRESAESIATGLRTIFTRIQRPETVENLKELGVNLRFTREEAAKMGDVGLENQFVGPFEAVKRLSAALREVRGTDPRFAAVAEELGGYRQISKTIPLLQEQTKIQQILNTAQAGGVSVTLNAEQAQAGLIQKVTKLREEFAALLRTITQSVGFQAFANIAITLGSALIKITDAITPLIPLLTALAAIKLGQGVVSLLGGFGQGFKGTPGSRLPAFASGGVVPGVGDTDSIHATLTPGEYVIRKDSAKKIGYENLAKLNQYAGGGTVRINPPGGRVGILTAESNVPEQDFTIIGNKRQALRPEVIDSLTQIIGPRFKDVDSISVNARTVVPASRSGSSFKDIFEKRVVKTAVDLGKEFFSPPESINTVDADALIKNVITTQGLGRIFEAAIQSSIGKAVNSSQQNFDFNPPHGRGLAKFIGAGIYAEAKYRDSFDARLSVLQKAATAVANKTPGFSFTDLILSKNESNVLRRAGYATTRRALGPNKGDLAEDFFSEQLVPPDRKFISSDPLKTIRGNFAEGGFALTPEALEEAYEELSKRTGIDFRKAVKSAHIGLPTGFKFSPDAQRSFDTSKGVFYKTDNRILLNPNRIRSQEELTSTLAHESTHGFDYNIFGQGKGFGSREPMTDPSTIAFMYRPEVIKEVRAKGLGLNSQYMGYRTQPEEILASAMQKYVSGDISPSSPLGKIIRDKFFNKLPRAYASGGDVDTVPAMLTPGEYVISREAAQKIGTPNLELMNKTGRLHFARGGRVPEFPTGGPVTGDNTGTPQLVAVGDIRQVAEAHKLEEQTIRALFVQLQAINPQLNNATQFLIRFGQGIATVIGEASKARGIFDIEGSTGKPSRQRQASVFDFAPGQVSSQGIPLAQTDPKGPPPSIFSQQFRGPSPFRGATESDLTVLGVAQAEQTRQLKVEANVEARVERATQGGPRLSQATQAELTARELANAQKELTREYYKQIQRSQGNILPSMENWRLAQEKAANSLNLVTEKLKQQGGGIAAGAQAFDNARKNTVPGEGFGGRFGGLLRGGGGFALLTGGSYLINSLQQHAGTAQDVAAGTRSETGFQAASAGSGAISGAFAGAAIGSAFAPGMGTAIGAGAGLLFGAATALYSSSKELSQASKELSRSQQGELASALASGELVNTPGNIERLRQRTLEVQGEATGKLSTLSGSGEEFTKGRDIIFRQSFGQNIGANTQFLNKMAADLGESIRPIGESTADDLKQQLDRYVRIFREGNNGLNETILRQIAAARGVPVEEVLRGFTNVIKTARDEANSIVAESQTTKIVRSFETLVKSIEDVTEHLGGFNKSIELSSTLASGGLAAPPVKNPATGLSLLGAPDQTEYRETLQRLAKPFGQEGEGFVKTGTAIGNVRQALIAALPGALASSGGEQADVSRNLTAGIEALLPKGSRTSEESTLVRRAVSNLNQIKGGPEGVLKIGEADPQRLVNLMLKGIEDQFKEGGDRIGKSMQEISNTFQRANAQINQQLQAAGQARDKEIATRVEGVLAIGRERARSEFREGSFPLNVPLAISQEPFAAVQRRLAGDGGVQRGLEFNPGAIGAELARVRTEARSTEARLQEDPTNKGLNDALSTLLNRSSLLSQALDNLSKVTQRNIPIQERLNVLRQDEASRVSLAQRFLSSDPQGRRELQRQERIVETAIEQGGVEGLSKRNQRRFFEFTGANPDILVNVGGENRKLGEVSREFAANANVPLAAARAAQGGGIEIKNLINEMQQNFVDGSKAYRESAQAFEDLAKINQKEALLANTTAIDKLTQSIELGRVQEAQAKAQQTGAVAGRLQKGAEQADILRGFGIENQKQLGFFNTGQNAKDIQEIADIANRKNHLTNLPSDTGIAASRKQFLDDLFNKGGASFDKTIGAQLIQSGEFDPGAVKNIRERIDARKTGPVSRDEYEELINEAIRNETQNKIRAEQQRIGVVQGRLEKAAGEGTPQRAAIPKVVAGITDDRLEQRERSLKAIRTGEFNEQNRLEDAARKQQEAQEEADRQKANAEFLADKLRRQGAVNRATGGSIFQPQGTDTVPAMLTPGEFIVNAQAAQANLPLLEMINSIKEPVYFAGGGPLDEIALAKVIPQLARIPGSAHDLLAYAKRRITQGVRPDIIGTNIIEKSQRAQAERLSVAEQASFLATPAAEVHIGRGIVGLAGLPEVGLQLGELSQQNVRQLQATQTVLKEGLPSELERLVNTSGAYHKAISPSSIPINAPGRRRFQEGGVVDGPTVVNTSIGGGGVANYRRPNSAVNSTDSGFSANVERFGGIIREFSDRITQLGASLSAIPTTISHQVTHNFNMNIVGGEFLANLEPTLQSYISRQVESQINDMIGSKFPDVGKVGAQPLTNAPTTG